MSISTYLVDGSIQLHVPQRRTLLTDRIHFMGNLGPAGEDRQAVDSPLLQRALRAGLRIEAKPA